VRQIPLGAKGSFSLLVQPEHLADRFKDAILPPVFAIPVMIMVMENAALNAIRGYLDPGESAVGTAVNIRHLAATPVGRLVTGWAEVTKVDGRQIEFTVRATEGAEEIGAGSHSRVVIEVAKFARRLGEQRLARLGRQFPACALASRASNGSTTAIDASGSNPALQHRSFGSCPTDTGLLRPFTMTTLWVFRSCVRLPRRLPSSHRFRGRPPGRGGFGALSQVENSSRQVRLGDDHRQRDRKHTKVRVLPIALPKRNSGDPIRA
jgi:fluoroacetyl-CoA thioesterase